MGEHGNVAHFVHGAHGFFGKRTPKPRKCGRTGDEKFAVERVFVGAEASCERLQYVHAVQGRILAVMIALHLLHGNVEGEHGIRFFHSVPRAGARPSVYEVRKRE